MTFNHSFLTARLKEGLEKLQQYGFLSLDKEGVLLQPSPKRIDIRYSTTVGEPRIR